MGIANAAGEVGSGTLGVGADVQGALQITFTTHAAGVTVTGSGSNTASVALGTYSSFSADGTVGGVTKSHATGNFTLSATVDIQVDVANSTSAAYNMDAQLAAADGTNTWAIGGIDISDGAAHTVVVDQTYGVPVALLLHLTVPNPATAGAIANSISFTATGQ